MSLYRPLLSGAFTALIISLVAAPYSIAKEYSTATGTPQSMLPYQSDLTSTAYAHDRAPDIMMPMPDLAPPPAPPAIDTPFYDYTETLITEEFTASPESAFDPMRHCESITYGPEDKHRCIRNEMARSDRELATFHNRGVHTAAARDGTSAVALHNRAMVNSAMAFTAFRDAECLRRKNTMPQTNRWERIDADSLFMACRTAMNRMRINMAN